MWKTIEDFENYEICETGEVRNKSTNKVLSPWTEKKGYLNVDLTNAQGRKHLKVHRLLAIAFIPNPENKAFVDHKNRIKNDNRLDNLRWADDFTNGRNKTKKIGTKSQYKGVTWIERDKKWKARIMFNYKMYNLGHYDSEEEAAAVYNYFAIRLFGEFANVNDIDFELSDEYLGICDFYDSKYNF